MNGMKYLLITLSFALLFLPLVQKRLGIAEGPKLFGIYKRESPPDLKYFTWKRWFEGTFQEKIAAQVNDNLGFRNSLVRINNQYDFSLFRIIHADGFIAGKKGFLYEEDYIHEYTGRYFIGKSAIDLKVRRLKAVQEELKKRGTRLLFVIEPGKASFFPEYIPDHYHPAHRTLTNMEYMKQRLDALKAEYIDLNRWFLSMKDTSRYKLFPEYGMHWSIYSVALVVDSLTHYLTERCNARVPDFVVEKVEISDSLRGSDRDIADMLNLVFPLRRVTAAYPVVRYDTARPSLRLIGVADSYFNNIYYVYAPHLFANTEYWYYNSTLYYGNSYGDVKVDHSNLAGKFKESDVILLMVSEINAHCGFWNFVDQAFEALFTPHRDAWTYKYENQIRNERWWFRGMVKEAAAEGIPLERAIRQNADYVMCVNYDRLENKTHADSVTRIIWDIKTTPKWLHKVWTVSRERNLPLETCLRSEAEYVLSQRNR
jgi:hypothetical protein